MKGRIPGYLRPGTRSLYCLQESGSVHASASVVIEPALAPNPVPPLSGDTASGAAAINQSGQALVTSTNSPMGTDHTAFLSGGHPTEVGGSATFPAGMFANLVAVNEGGPAFCSFAAGSCPLAPVSPPLGGSSASAGDLNASLLVGGSQVTGNTEFDGFVCTRTASGCSNPIDLTPLGTPPFPDPASSNAEAISANNWVTGESSTDTSPEVAVRCQVSASACTLTSLGTLGGTNSEGHDVNASGQVVGESYYQPASTARRAFLYTGGTMKNLGVLPGDGDSYAYGINDSTEVVGNSSSGSFLWANGRMFRIDSFVTKPAGATIHVFNATDINDLGQIIGTGEGSLTNNRNEAVILSPQGMIAPVAITGTGFSPTAATVHAGGTVEWANNGPGSHNVVDTSGMGLFHSPSLGVDGAYTFTFPSAGTYPYRDTLHNHTGTVEVPMADAPTSGHTSTLFQLYFGAGTPPTGYRYDVQVERPGSASFASLVTGNGTGITSFKPNAGAGNYFFRARLRNTTNGKFSGWSTPLKIAVSP